MDLFRPAEELYDLEKDPFEINNLAESTEYKLELEKLRMTLNEWVEKKMIWEPTLKLKRRLMPLKMKLQRGLKLS